MGQGQLLSLRSKIPALSVASGQGQQLSVPCHFEPEWAYVCVPSCASDV